MMLLHTKLYTLIKDVIGSETLIFADQNSPRPANPYWIIKVNVQRQIGNDGYSQGVDNLGNIKIKGVREATVYVQRIGTNAVDACSDLRDNLSRVTVQEKWQFNNIAVYDVGNVMDAPFMLDSSQLEPRANLDLFVRFGSELLDNVGIIETVKVESEYVTKQTKDLTDINPDLAQEINVVL